MALPVKNIQPQTGATLFLFSGLPASGKTTLAGRLAREFNAVYLRIDTLEQALRDLCNIEVEGEGYRLAYRIAADNLTLGRHVVADSCNPIPLTRDEWRETARRCGANVANIEIVCSDKTEHRKRTEERRSSVEGLKLPTWSEVENHIYQPWEASRIVIDTAGKSVEESFHEMCSQLRLLFS